LDGVASNYFSFMYGLVWFWGSSQTIGSLILNKGKRYNNLQGFMVEACGCIAGHHFSWSSFIKQADLLANVSLYQPRD
jgi:hypothetical protein